MNASRELFGLLFFGLLAARLCHSDILWVEESYPAAAALQILHGKVPYRDFWFDKPPLAPLLYLLWNAQPGWLLRLAGALFVTLCSWLAWRFALEVWDRREAVFAASLVAFYLTFGIPSAVMALAPDLLLLAPHLAAVWLAVCGLPFWAGFAAGIASLFHVKGLVVLAACLLWRFRSAPTLFAGFALPNLFALALLGGFGALWQYLDQVWHWGAIYARDTFLDDPLREGLLRTLNWAGFHATVVVGAAWFWWRERSANALRLALWALLGLGAVIVGWRFFPRYYFHLLPAMLLAGSRGLALLGRRGAVVVLALLLVPLVRFGPRYALLAQDIFSNRPHRWSDLAMNQDSRRAAAMVSRLARPGDTLLVWGYRPDVFVYTRLPAGTRFLDSQLLTGVIADRHLVQSQPSAPELAERYRRELARCRPSFVVDGLGPYNPALSVDSYTDLADWLKNYRVVGRTDFSVIYQLAPAGAASPTSQPSRESASPGTPSSPPVRPAPARSSP